MAKASFSTEAELDLKQIAAYIARDNLLAALSWLQETRAVCHLIATQPGMGQQLETVRYGPIRRHVIGNYLIYFNPNATGIDVVRVVHGSREQERLV